MGKGITVDSLRKIGKVKFLSLVLILAFILITSGQAVGAREPPCGSYGDVNDDGYVTEKDKMLVWNATTRDQELSSEERERGDVNDDGLDSFDANVIDNYIKGQIDSFPVCPETKRCDDGTAYGNCSINKPFYCDNGTLVHNCSLCGCSSGMICQEDDRCCDPLNCEELGHECGDWDDGCGRTIDCGVCDTFEKCESGECVRVSKPDILIYDSLKANLTQAKFMIGNVGEKNAGSFEVLVEVDGKEKCRMVEEGLNAGEQKEYTCSYNLAPGRYNLTVTVDPLDKVPELKEDNNVRKIVITAGKKPPCDSYGDVNDDGYVTEKDKMLVWNATTRDQELSSEERERGDVNDDGLNSYDSNLIDNYVKGEIDTFKACTLSCGDLFKESEGAIRFADSDFSGNLSGKEAEALDPDYWSEKDRKNALKFAEKNCSFEVWSCQEVKGKFKDTIQKQDLNGNGKLNETEVLLAGKKLGGKITGLEYAGLWNFGFNDCNLKEGPEIDKIRNLPQSPTEKNQVKLIAQVSGRNSKIAGCNYLYEYKDSRTEFKAMKAKDGSFNEKEEFVQAKLGNLEKGGYNVTIKCSNVEDDQNKENHSFYVSSVSCGETDNGKDPETPGLVNYKEVHNDSCSNGNLTEYYCSSKGVKKKEYNCSTYCEKEKGINYKGTCSLKNKQGFCECEKKVEKNIKDMSKYSDKQAFLVSDQNWRRTLSLVPVTTWTQQEGIDQKCQRGYQTAEGVCTYPNLIYHREGEKKEISTKNLGEPRVKIKDQKGPVIVGVYDEDPCSKFPNRLLVVKKSVEQKKIEVGEEFKVDLTVRNCNEKSDLKIKKLKVDYKNKYDEYFSSPNSQNLGEVKKGEKKKISLAFEFKKPLKRAFDVDSTIYFLQQYEPDSLKIVGKTSNNLDNLLIADPSTGAGLNENQITRISKNNYPNYWKSYEDIVYVENNYKKALVASTYASLINAPLLIKGYNDDISLKKKNIVCVGGVDEKCDKKYTKKELQKKYLERTSTDKLTLVNPQDLKGKKELDDLTETKKCPTRVGNIFAKDSLAAPYLASGKHELILSIDKNLESMNEQGTVAEIDKEIEEKIKKLKISPKYLTIVSSPDSIKMTIPNAFGPRLSADVVEYSNLEDEDIFLDLATGRIFGLTVSDTSSNIARSLHYNKLPKGDELLFARGKKSYNDAQEVYALGNIMSDLGYPTKTTPEDTEPEDWEDKLYIHYEDHGFTAWSGIPSEKLPKLSNSMVTSQACLTCSFFKNPKGDLFCAKAIRRGAVGYLGTVDNAYAKSMEPFLLGVFSRNLSIGEAFMNSKNAWIANVNRNERRERSGVGYPRYTLLGDPTLNLKTKHLLTKPKIKKTWEKGKVKNYSISFFAEDIKIPESIVEISDDENLGSGEVRSILHTNAYKRYLYKWYSGFAARFPSSEFKGSLPSDIVHTWDLWKESWGNDSYIWFRSPFVPDIESEHKKFSLEIKTSTVGCIDEDGDNFGKKGNYPFCPNKEKDCNDSDSSINPEAFEALGFEDVCQDGLDNDCDDKIDSEDPECKKEIKPPCDSYGDVDNDSYITGNDFIKLFKENTENWEKWRRERGDINGDGTIDSYDALRIQKYWEGKIETFEVCKNQ